MINSMLSIPRMSLKNSLIFILVVCFCVWLVEAHEPASHLQIIRDLPNSMRKDIPIPMVIRSNYKGAVHFQEGDEFEILINITAPTVEDAYAVHIEMVEYKEGVLLQLYQRPLDGHIPGLKWVFLTVGISTLISFFFALICANSWNKSQGFMDVSGQPMECYDMTQQPMMYRSRNSMYLASQAGDLPLHAEEEADNNQNEDTLKGVPEMPEEEEAEALRMEELKKSGAFEATRDLSDDSGGERDEEETEFMKSEYATLPVRVDLAWPERKGNGDEGVEQSELSEGSSKNSIIDPSASSPMKTSLSFRSKDFRKYQGNQGKSEPKLINVPSPSQSEFQDFQSAASDESRILVTAAEIHSKDATKQQFKAGAAQEASDAFVNVLVKTSPIETPSFSPQGNIPLADDLTSISDNGQSSAFRSGSDCIFENDAQKVFLGTTDTSAEVDSCLDEASQIFPMPNLEEVQPASSITSSADSKAAWFSASVTAPGQPRLATFRPVSPRAASPGKLGSPMTPDSGDETNGRSQSNQSTPKRSKTLLGVAPPQVPQKYHTLKEGKSGESPKDEQPGQGPGSSGTVGRKPSPGSKHMYLAIMSCMCLLSLTVGVYSYGNEITETEVIVTVSTPKNFLLNDSAIFFSMNKTGDLKIFELPLKVTWFEVKNPILRSYNTDMCESRWCEQGCDENTGRCICRKGFKLDVNEKCSDVNECLDGLAQCHKYAGCHNEDGGYQCVCTGHYFGDGKRCKECSAPCERGMFEVQPCSEKEQKICKECTKDCGRGYYMHRQCGPTFDAKCRMCLPKCQPHEYEYSKCTGPQNRICRDKTELPAIQTSSNVLKEDRSKVKDIEHDVRYLPDMEWKYENTFNLQRGSNMAAKIEVVKLDPVHKFIPVDHSSVNDNQAFFDRSILHKYCPYPMPSYYQLEYVVHKDVTYEMDRGVNTNDQLLPCRGYQPHGRFPDLRQPDRSSLLCAKIGPLAKMFGIEEELTEMTTVRVQKSIRCERMNVACENCTKMCAWQSPVQKDDCKVIADDADNGWSPRLRICYTCCLHTKCSSICDRYYSSPCRPKVCLKGSVLEFILKPVFTETMFCHVQPAAQRTLLEVDFTITYDERRLHKETFQIGAEPEWLRDGSMNNIEYKFLQIDISSGIEKMPDVVAMDQTTKSLKAGLHRKSGHNLAGSVVQSKKLFIHPQEIFGVSLQNWALQNCSRDILEKLMMVSEKDEPYIEMSDVLTSHMREITYMIVNNSVTPKAVFRVPHTMSLLQWVAPYGRIKHDSIIGSIQHSSSRWVVMLEGNLEACPGFFSVNLTDTTYYDQPLFQYDLLVECPPTFQLTFSIPTSDAANVEKAFTASIRDANVTYHLTIHRPPQDLPQEQPLSPEEETPVVDEDGYDQKKPFFSSSGSFFIPFIASICGAIIILLSIAGFGIVAKQGCIDANEVSLFNQRHLMVSVVYFSCQVFYSTLVTLTSFMVIIYAINKDPLTYLSQYDQLSIVKSSLTNLEMTTMKLYLQTELERQHAVANQTKGVCEEQMMKVAQGLNELKGNLTKEAKEVMSQENLSNLIRNHTRRVLDEFLGKIIVYWDRLNNYVNIIQKRLQFDVRQTYKSVMENRWLTGAKHLHSDIQQKRQVLHSNPLQTRPYAEWMEIEPNISNLAQGLLLSIQKLPQFDEVFKERTTPITGFPEVTQNNKTESTNYTRNLWFYTERKHSMGHRNMTDFIENSSKKSSSNQIFYTFVGIMVIIDVMWFLHRMVNIMRTTRLLLYGYPVYVDCREGKDRGLPSVDNAHRRPSTCCKSTKKRCCHAVSQFVFKILKTMFVPKLIISLLMLLFIYLTSAFSEKLFRRESFQTLGYYTDITSLLELSRADINSRIRMHATQINAMEYPMLEAWMNSYLKRHLHLHDVYQNSVRKLSKTHSITYCEYLQRYLPDAKCTVRDLENFKVEVKGCKFPPIEPKPYKKIDVQHSRVAARQMDSFLYAVRKMISDSCFVVLLYMSFIILWDLTSTVIWLYAKRAGWIRLRVICETDERPMVRDE